jgi:DUF4097 and DUF4098 domain-containing protein YvlB
MLNQVWIVAVALGLGAGLLAAAPVQGETRIEKRLALAPGGRLIVRTDVGGVSVRGDAAATGATVLLTADRDDFEKDYEVSLDSTAGQAQVIVKRRRPGWSWFGDWGLWRGRVELAIGVPHATSASVRASGGHIEVSGLEGDTDLGSSGGSVHARDLAGKLDAHSSGGGIEATDLRGEVRLRSSGGTVRAASVRGTLSAESSGGGVHLERISGDLRASSSGGGITVRDAGGRVEASSSGGSIRVGFAPGNAHGGNIGSTGGGVEVRLDPGVGLNLDASSTGGSVTCDLPVTVQGKVSRHSVRGVLRGGGERLHLHSTGGGVRVASL